MARAAWRRAAIDLGEVVLRIEAELRRQAGIAGVEDAVEFLLGAARVVAQACIW
jgi:hypothetical protein